MDFTIMGFGGSDLLALLGGVSVATERIVEIAKGWVRPLNRESPPNPDPMVEAKRRALNQLASLAMALPIGMGMAIWLTTFSSDPLELNFRMVFDVLALAVLASGGSGFWNGILGAIGVFTATASPPRPRAPRNMNRPNEAQEPADEAPAELPQV